MTNPRWKAFTVAMPLGILSVLTGCADDTTAAVAAVAVSDTALSEKDRRDCAEMFAQAPVIDEHVIAVFDLTRSTSAVVVPQPLATSLIELSKKGGAVSVIGVNGEDSAPVIVLEKAGLSPSDSARDAPSVADIATYMPECILDRVIETGMPTAPGTDPYSALKAAEELITPATTAVWLLTDLQFNTGPYALQKQDLGSIDGAEETAGVLAAAAPVDLQGKPMYIEGVANTTPPLSPHGREWSETLAQGLCKAWKAAATSCERIKTSPDDAPPREDIEGLPADDPLPFPKMTSRRISAASCEYDMPSELLFAGDSAQVRADADDVLSEPIRMMADNPSSTGTITGHTASSVNYAAEDLIRLSLERANAVKARFASAGIRVERLAVVGVGDRQPLAEDLDADGRQIPPLAARERRVTVSLAGVPCPLM